MWVSQLNPKWKTIGNKTSSRRLQFPKADKNIWKLYDCLAQNLESEISSSSVIFAKYLAMKTVIANVMPRDLLIDLQGEWQLKTCCAAKSQLQIYHYSSKVVFPGNEHHSSYCCTVFQQNNIFPVAHYPLKGNITKIEELSRLLYQNNTMHPNVTSLNKIHREYWAWRVDVPHILEGMHTLEAPPVKELFRLL